MNDYANQPTESSSFEEVQRRGALVLRTLPILLIPIAVTLITGLILRLTTGVPPPPPNDPGSFLGPLIPIVVISVFCSALIVLVRLGRPTISALILISAWTLVTTLVSLRFGVTTYFPALLIMPICAAGLLIDGVASISLAALATLLVASLAWLEQRGWTFFYSMQQPPDFIREALPTLSVGFWVSIFWTVAALTWLLAGGLQRALKQSRAQANALRQLSEQLEARVQQQTAQILDREREAATLEERARLAREIHDTLAQGLAGIVMQVGAAQRALRVQAPETNEHLDLASRMAREALAEARRSVWNLRAPALERGDLSAALRSFAERPAQDGLRVRFEQRGEPWVLSAAVESALLRVSQEALANVAKHARATHADLALEYTPDAVRLSVCDDGIGFDAATLTTSPAPEPWGGFGLPGMRERLAAFGGTLTLANDGGARVVACVPRIENAECRMQN